MGAEPLDLKLTEDREMHQGCHSQALGMAPRSTAIFFFSRLQKIPRFISLSPPLRSIPEGIQAGVSPARAILQALENSAKVVPRPWKLEEAGGGCGHWAAYEAVPLDVRSWGGPLCGGCGRTGP